MKRARFRLYRSKRGFERKRCIKRFRRYHKGAKIIKITKQIHRGKPVLNITWIEPVKNAVWHIRGLYKKRGKKGSHPFWIEVIAIVGEDLEEDDVLKLAQKCVDDWFDKEGFYVPLEKWKIRFEEYTDEPKKIEVVKWGHTLS